MPVYVYKIQGKNFLMEMDGKQGKYGFFTFRVAQAKDMAEGEQLAVQMIRNEPGLKDVVKNTPDDPPSMDVLDVYEIANEDDFEDAPGLIWYEIRPKRRWQFWRSSS